MTRTVVENSAIGSRRWVLRHFWILLGMVLVFRLWVDTRFALMPDEAVYWVWSRHLALGYFDHPPMIAWINWLSTHLIGSTELGVRAPASIMMMATIAVIVSAAKTICKDELGVKWIALIWLTSPLLAGIATIFTPDTPMIFFDACALWFALRVARRDDGEAYAAGSPLADWLGFGVCCGLGFLSKYPAVLLPMAVVLSFLISPKGRKHFWRPGIYLAAIVSLVIFSPVIWWNAHHQWASFLFQLHHGVSDDPDQNPVTGAMRIGRVFLNLFLYAGGQGLLFTPVLFVLGVVILFQKARRLRCISEVDRLLWCAAVLPLGVFCLTSLHKLGEANWPAFAYVPLSLLIVRWMIEKDIQQRAHVVKEGVKLALIFTIVMHIPIIPGVSSLIRNFAVHHRVPHNLRDLLEQDPRKSGRELADAAEQASAVVVCNRHQAAAMASFYMPGQPDIWCDSVASRPTAYDYFDEKPDFSTIPRVLFLGGHPVAFMAKYGYSNRSTITVGPPDSHDRRTAVLISR